MNPDSAAAKIAIVLGAGASWDVSLDAAPVCGRWRPPLARELFGARLEEQYWELIEPYKGAVTLAQDLATRSHRADFDVEKELRAYFESDDARTHQLALEIPAYLRDLLHRVSNRYTRAPGAYLALLQQLADGAEREIAFIVLNYDTLLEQALVTRDGSFHFNSLGGYVQPGRAMNVYKLHGSINWVTPLPRRHADWFTAVRESDPTPPFQTIRVVDDFEQTFRRHEQNWVYPVLTAPLAGKGATGSVCPPHHATTLAEFLGDCRRYLWIGARALDQDLLSLLKDNIARVDVVHYVGREDIGCVKPNFYSLDRGRRVFR